MWSWKSPWGCGRGIATILTQGYRGELLMGARRVGYAPPTLRVNRYSPGIKPWSGGVCA